MIGATAIEDKLQDDVPDTIATLAEVSSPQEFTETYLSSDTVCHGLQGVFLKQMKNPVWNSDVFLSHILVATFYVQSIALTTLET